MRSKNDDDVDGSNNDDDDENKSIIIPFNIPSFYFSLSLLKNVNVKNILFLRFSN